jgi:hypothetical protein
VVESAWETSLVVVKQRFLVRFDGGQHKPHVFVGKTEKLRLGQL